MHYIGAKNGGAWSDEHDMWSIVVYNEYGIGFIAFMCAFQSCTYYLDLA